MRPAGDIIESSGRVCDGVCKPLKIADEIAFYVDQNKKRAGAHVFWLAAYHPDIFEFIYMKDQFKDVEKHALRLFYGVWADRLFFEQVEKNGDWYLLSPVSYPGLNLVYGKEFDDLYFSYVREAEEKGLLVDRSKFMEERSLNEGILDGLVLRLPARQLMCEIIKAQSSTGVPYLMDKTRVNECSNFPDIIESSNLCCEITLPYTENMTNVCCLASIKISEFFSKPDGPLKSYEEFQGLFNFPLLAEVTRQCVRNLDRVLSINKYPNELSRKGAEKYRAIGIGQQDLSSLYMKAGIAYDSNLASEINFRIQEFIYFHAIDQSCDLAALYGPFPAFPESKMAAGIFQFDCYPDFDHRLLSGDLDWSGLREKMKKGVRNGTLLANMPTAGTAIITGSEVESVEPLYSNIYTRKFAFGEYPIVNRYLVEALEKNSLNTSEMRDAIIRESGNLAGIPEVPEGIKKVFATVYEFGMKPVIDQYADRQRFVCQSQSMNVYPFSQDIGTIWKTYLYGVKCGLKTICYYYRGRTDISAQKNFEKSSDKGEKKGKYDDYVCQSCSS